MNHVLLEAIQAGDLRLLAHPWKHVPVEGSLVGRWTCPHCLVDSPSAFDALCPDLVGNVLRELLMLPRVETWKNQHKARTVEISHPDGYGAGCWTVVLGHEKGVTVAEEAMFFALPEERGGEEETRKQAREAGVVFVKEEGDDENGWPGLARTIEAALNAVEQGVFKKRSLG